ncbi:MAG: N-acetyltransferase [Deltaproteobacteria bacterium]|nr:N-acetyltransferase [Deltaproteobacteria bacterium]MBI5902455.1 N-acetyltransferase [Deltaproteobacteria bacterium]
MVRKAVLNDAESIYSLIEYFAKKGGMLHRPLADIYDSLRDFFVYEEDGRVTGTCALHISGPDMGEIRSLAVSEDRRGRGIGRKLVTACLDEARSIGLKSVFALTYQVGFFHRLGFRGIKKEVLPSKIWSDCVKCVKFPNCDENAVIVDLQ